MSKHIGNVVDPWEVLDKQGADAVRWYFYASSAPWLPTRFSGDLVSEMQRKFMGTLWNTYAFFTLYASIDNYDPLTQKADRKDFSLMDKWILSKLQTLIVTVDEGLDKVSDHRDGPRYLRFRGRAVQLVRPPLPRALLGQGPRGRQAGRL